MKPFTVLLLLPDYATEDFGELRLVLTEAPDLKTAVTNAQREVAAALALGSDPDDFKPAALFAGHQTDLILDYYRELQPADPPPAAVEKCGEPIGDPVSPMGRCYLPKGHPLPHCATDARGNSMCWPGTGNIFTDLAAMSQHIPIERTP